MQKSRITLSAVALVLATTSAAWAQQDAPAASTPQTATQAAAPSASDFSRQDVARFAQANRKVQDLQARYTKKLQDAGKDQQKAAEVKQEAENKMVGAVQNTGLSVQTYNDMIQVARADPKFARRIQAQQKK